MTYVLRQNANEPIRTKKILLKLVYPCMLIFSDLPDSDDIQSQVLLLGITRYDTTPTPSHFDRCKRLYGPQLKSTCDNNRIAYVGEKASISSLIAVYQSTEHLSKSGCFPLDRHKTKQKPPKPSEKIVQPQQQSDNHLNRFFDRFQHKRSATTNDNSSTASKTFHRWLHLRRTNNRPNQSSDVATDEWQLPQHRQYTKRKCLTKSGSFKTQSSKSKQPSKASKSKSKSKRFASSCLPYCTLSVRNDSIASNSLASSQFRYSESYKKRGPVTLIESQPQQEHHQHHHHHHRQQQQQQQSPASDEYLLHPSYSKVNNNCAYNRNQSNQNTDNDTNRNNNCSLANNLNVMDRSVDSIGSCSLDVDAESTDFSGILFRHITTSTISESTKTLEKISQAMS